MAGRREVTIVEAAEERRLVGPNPNDLGAYMSGIDAMPRKGLENRLSEAQEALDAIETKLRTCGFQGGCRRLGGDYISTLAALKLAGT